MVRIGNRLFFPIFDPSWSEISISDYDRDSNQPCFEDLSKPV
jgi:hypothetical protein